MLPASIEALRLDARAPFPGGEFVVLGQYHSAPLVNRPLSLYNQTARLRYYYWTNPRVGTGARGQFLVEEEGFTDEI
jgi:hypothetical protein